MFTQIQPAIDSAIDGDVVVVKSGNYAAFNADKRLTIVGPEFSGSPLSVKITDTSRVHDTTGFTLAGLSLERLVIRDVTGPVTIDECWLNQSGFLDEDPTVDVLRVNGLVISRSSLSGGGTNNGINPLNAGAWGLRVDSSLFTVDSSTISGGEGDSLTGCGGSESAGGPGIESIDSIATIVNSTLRGGAGSVYCCLCTCCFQDSGGIPLRATGGQVQFLGPITLVKPSSNQPLGGLLNASGSELIWATSNPPTNVILTAGASFTSVSSGVWLSVTGSDTPGQVRNVRVAAPLGSLGILAFGPPRSPSFLSGYFPDLWLSLADQLFLWPIVGTGASSTVLDLTLPTAPGLVGTQLLAQAAFPTVQSSIDPASATLSNPAPIVLRF
jgi:hypothetical protein